MTHAGRPRAPWVTNNPEVAARLRAIDAAYLKARQEARELRLSDKVEAYRTAKATRDAAYDAVIASLD